MKKRTQLLREKDKNFLWHPFTQMKEWQDSQPLVIESGKGAVLRDTEGREYVDGVGSLWCNVHGHRRDEIDRAIRRQLGKVAHTTLLGAANIPSTLLAEKLASLAPGNLTRVFYSDSGSTAVEIALKIAYQYWQQKGRPRKKRFVALENAYHGDTLGAVSVGGIDLFHKIYHPLLFKCFRAPSPSCYRCSLGKTRKTCNLDCAEELGIVLSEHAEEIAAVIVEPLVQGAAGILTAAPQYLRRVRQLCTQHDILLIADEVAAGIGRSGRLFACEHERVVPDLLCIGKGLSGGYLPLAATLATNNIFRAFLGEHTEYKTFFHGHTFTGNPLACAAALACLDIFEKEETLRNLTPKIKHIAFRLQRMRKLPHVGDVRQCGMIAGIELVKNKRTKEPFPSEDKIGVKVTQGAREEGVLLRPLGDVIVICPPLSITIDQIDQIVDAIEKHILAVLQQ